MPYRNRSVMGGSQGWQHDDQEKAAINAQSQYADQAARMYLAQMQSSDNRYNTDAMLASTGRASDRQAHELQRYGTFDQQSGHDLNVANLKAKGERDVAGIQYGANNTLAGLAVTQYGDVAPAVKAKASAEAEKIAMMNALMKSYLPQAGAPAVAGVGHGMSAEDGAFLAFGGSPADLMKSRSDDKRYQRDREAQAEQNKMQLAQSLAAGGNVSGAAGLFQGVNGFQDMTDEQLTGMLQQPVDPANVESILTQKLPDFINRDTQSWWSRGLKGAGAGAATLGGAGAIGGSFLPGVGTAIGGVGGLGVGGVSGFVGGALSSKGDPEDSETTDIQALFSQLVEGYTAQNGGRRDLAFQQAKAKMQEIAKTSDQGDDYLTDWDGDKTKLLFQGLK